jgi:two-component system KDP operon response regulator KdpE
MDFSESVGTEGPASPQRALLPDLAGAGAAGGAAARRPATWPRLLVVEGAEETLRAVSRGSREVWPECQVTVARSGAAALRRLLEGGFDLVVLNPAVPPPGGLELLRRVRELSPAPLLVLSHSAGAADKVRALDLGADDYLTKPYDGQELLARLRALLRRALTAPTPSGAPGAPGPAPAPAAFAAGDLTVDCAAHEVRLRGAVVALSPTERRLLEALARSPGTTLPPRSLLDRVWGPEYAGDARFLKVIVHRLRRKLGDDVTSPRYVQTVRGAGYRLAGGASARPGRWAPATA